MLTASGSSDFIAMLPSRTSFPLFVTVSVSLVSSPLTIFSFSRLICILPSAFLSPPNMLLNAIIPIIMITISSSASPPRAYSFSFFVREFFLAIYLL